MSTAAIDLLQDSSGELPSGLLVPQLVVDKPLELPEPGHTGDNDDIDIGNAMLDGRTVDAHFGGAVVDGTLTRTISGASTLEMVVNDPDRRLIKGHVITDKFKKNDDVYITLDGRDFALVKIRKVGDQFTLAFENRLINEMRKVKGAKKAFRDTVTRAEFILQMVREVKGYPIKFYAPELHKNQPIANKKQKSSATVKRRLRHSGIAKGTHLTVKGAKATAQQIRNANQVLDVAYSRNAPYPCMLALIEACIVESTMINLRGGDLDSAGILQQRPSQGWGTYAQVRDVSRAAKKFLDRAIPFYRSNPRASTGQIAQHVQGSAFPGRYIQYKNEAIAFVAAYGAHGGSGSITVTTVKRFPFTRGGNEDAWTAAKRLAKQVDWLLFAVDDTLWYLSWQRLLASAARMTISEDSDGINSIDFDVDKGKQVEQVTILARASRWVAPPGTVVMLEDTGPADGRWILSDHRRPIFSRQAEITLKRPGHSRKEPAPATKTIRTRAAQQIGGLGAVAKAYAKAKAISKRHLPYTWGGGHGSFNPGPGYDCSGYVSACLHAAGWLSHPEATGGLVHWGHAGHGRYLTVWVKSTGAAHIDHTFMEFHMPGKGIEHFGTGRWGTASSGPGFKPNRHPKAGFVPRHWPGF